MPDWGGGLFTAFMAAKDVGKNDGKDELPDEPVSAQDAEGQEDELEQAGFTQDPKTGAWTPPQGGQQGGAWGRGRGFGK